MREKEKEVLAVGGGIARCGAGGCSGVALEKGLHNRNGVKYVRNKN